MEMETTSYYVFYRNRLTFYRTKPSGAQIELCDVNVDSDPQRFDNATQCVESNPQRFDSETVH